MVAHDSANSRHRDAESQNTTERHAAEQSTPHPLWPILTHGGDRADRATHIRSLPPRGETTTTWPVWVDTDITAGYQNLGVMQPWVHQVQAAHALWNGKNTVISTSTGSGKSLGFWLPALSSVGRLAAPQQRNSVLYLSPTKALAQDQLSGLERLLAAMPEESGRTLRIATCDGDTPSDERPWVRDYADVVLTNPDFLHFSLLPNHRRWTRLLRSLRYVIIDEAHTYRGVFGAHMSMVLRRLARLSSHYRRSTESLTFAIASATSAEPGASAARLLGVPTNQVTVINEDTSPAGQRTIILWRPPQIIPWGARADAHSAAHWSGHGNGAQQGGIGSDDERVVPLPLERHEPLAVPAEESTSSDGDFPRRTATAEASDLLADLVQAGARTLTFARSRRAVESIAERARHTLQSMPQIAATIAAYRGGYLPEERRALEEALRTGTVRGLATTNALELGVDIRGLDAVLIAGWPGTLMSLWQQAGRAGRAGSDGLVTFIARDDPLDTYMVLHPESIFDAPVEATVFDPTNKYVLAAHLCAAAAEIPLRGADLPRFGPLDRVHPVLTELTDGGLLRRRNSGWYWTHIDSASGLTDLRGSGGSPVRVVESPSGRLLGTVDAGSADGQVHEGAVYVHQGVSFVIEKLDLADGVAIANRRLVDHGTWSRELTSISVVNQSASQADQRAPIGHADMPEVIPRPHEQASLPEALRRMAWGPVTWGFGPVEVTNQVVSFERRRIPDMQVLGTQTLDLPEHTLTTMAVWWSIPASTLESANIPPEHLPGALHAAEHAAIGMLPLVATCDRWDLGGVSTDVHPDTGQATVFVYDAYPGGAGFAERGFEAAAPWIRATREVIAECPCDHGCPSCIQSPKCGTNNAPLHKGGALVLLDTMLTHIR
ncbi:MAG: DEAD/DEAH box helicase [Cellulomonadaceae bacterium]|jgi:DEAD/DEAH box helicase domain-containing protein|nr:DEAD/DEAH box helicase [Cellulomonadaceae bacterium]